MHMHRWVLLFLGVGILISAEKQLLLQYVSMLPNS